MTLSFLRGLVAAVNPCGFVLLPTYLMYFLGTEAGRASAAMGTQRAGMRRALVVSGALTTGFIGVFIAVGLITYNFTSWIQANAKYATIVIAVGLVSLGVVMLTGRTPVWLSPRLDIGGRDRSLWSMVLFGVAYAVASLGCTIGLFLPSIFTVRDDGIITAVGHVAVYAAGMGLVVTALTVSLAVANVGLLRVLRGAMRHVDRVAAGFVIASGVYLAWYFWVVDIRGDIDPVTGAVESVQRNALRVVNDHWQIIAVVLVAVVAAAITAVLLGRGDDAPHTDVDTTNAVATGSAPLNDTAES